MDVILDSFKCKFSLVYLEDVVSFSNKVHHQIDHQKSVLTSLKKSGMKLKLKKCFSFHNKIEYLGNVISPGSLKVAPQATDAIEKLNLPSKVTKLISFLGLCNVLRLLVPSLALISSQLNLKLRKEQPKKLYSLSGEELGTLATLQEIFVTPPVLALPISKGEYFFYTDSCDRQAEWLLIQHQ